MRKINIQKDFKNDFITREAGEKLRLRILETLKKEKMIELDFRNTHVASLSFFDEAITKLLDEGFTKEDLSKKIKFKNISSFDDALLRRLLNERKEFKKERKIHLQEKVHPWRMCPAGEHWVQTHSLHAPPSSKDPDGSLTTRHAHCAKNPSGKDQLYPEEIQEIALRNFSNLTNKPCALSLKFKDGSKFDEYISGWVQYWNDILKPSVPLDPNAAKALIASESGFDPKRLFNKRDSNSARGLMQITNNTRKILQNEKGELPDHFLNLTKENLNDPNVNICAGVRWLFRKRELAKNRLGREATWIEAVQEYKGDLKGILAGNAASKRDVQSFLNYLEELQKCGKK